MSQTLHFLKAPQAAGTHYLLTTADNLAVKTHTALATTGTVSRLTTDVVFQVNSRVILG